MNTKITYRGRPGMFDELKAMTDEQLRALKVKYSEAKGGTHEHRIMTECDRLLRSKEGTYQALVLR